MAEAVAGPVAVSMPREDRESLERMTDGAEDTVLDDNRELESSLITAPEAGVPKDALVSATDAEAGADRVSGTETEASEDEAVGTVETGVPAPSPCRRRRAARRAASRRARWNRASEIASTSIRPFASLRTSTSAAIVSDSATHRAGCVAEAESGGARSERTGWVLLPARGSGAPVRRSLPAAGAGVDTGTGTGTGTRRTVVL